MLQNRVDPFANIIITPARGAWTGNRGVLHDHDKKILRPFRLKAWITCQLEFKGRKRPVMAPDRWTELFFLDEATALAAGHRPCFECRRMDATRFKAFWLKGNPEYHFNEKTSIGEIDKIIHEERIDRHQSKITYEEKSDRIPNGAFITRDGKAYLVKDRCFFLWMPAGYEKVIPLDDGDLFTVLTPRSIVNALRAGYLPQMAL